MTPQSTAPTGSGVRAAPTIEQRYEHVDTRELVRLVGAAAQLVRTKGESAFIEFRAPGSRWREGESYIFVLDAFGRMLVHPDPALEGKNDLELKDIHGRPIIRGLVAAATELPDKPEGWHHYEWPVPGGILPRWKSSYVRLVEAPSGSAYIVGSGMYNERMERAFVVDIVRSAVGEIEKRGAVSFPRFRDPADRFAAKDAYVFVTDLAGIELVNPAFPNLEGRNLLDFKDTQGRPLIREMLDVVRTRGTGWVDYMWPKPGESVSTRKSAYVSAAQHGQDTFLVGCGVYLAGAPREARSVPTMTAPELMQLVREGASVLEERGEEAYPEFRKRGSKWFRDRSYFFAFTMDGTRAFHATEAESEGRDDSGLRDMLGRPIVRMVLDTAATPSGEGWIHYMYPEPGSIFPGWKSSFVKRVRLPSGEQHVLGCGIYGMPMDKAFIEDVVGRAAALIAERGKEAFGLLRDRTGPFVFMDTYVFVASPDGTEMVNAAQPALEGRNLLDLRDLHGKTVVRDELALALQEGSGWLECYWYRPGDNVPVRKLTYVRKVQRGAETYVVGSGIYSP